MDRTSLPSLENDARKGNQRVKVHALAIEILRNTPGIMTMAEAVSRAKAQLGVR